MEKHPVFRFDLSGCPTNKALRDELENTVANYEREYGVTPTALAAKNRFENLIEMAAGKEPNSVVLLFDEYDSPLQNTLCREAEHEAMRDTYREFFSCVKRSEKCLRLVFLTGIMKFTQLSLFSVMNKVTIASADPKYDTAFGITHRELKKHFGPHMKSLAKSLGVTAAEAFQKLVDHYDSYCFSEAMRPVLNPLSVVKCFADGRLDNYWTVSGSTMALLATVDSGEHRMPNWEEEYLAGNVLRQQDADRNNLPLTLYQTGYMTIKGYDAARDKYRIGIPNEEVREAVAGLIVPRITNKREVEVHSEISDFKYYFITGELGRAMEHLKALVAGTPYANDKTEKAAEDRFQFILAQVLFLCGFNPSQEPHQATGRPDIVCATKWRNAVFELKMTSNGGLRAAREQLEERAYAAPLLAQEKPLCVIAVEFDAAQRGITGVDIRDAK